MMNMTNFLVMLAFSMNAKNEVVQVHILARQAQQLAYPHTGVQGGDGDDLCPRFITPDGLPVYYPLHLLRTKRR